MANEFNASQGKPPSNNGSELPIDLGLDTVELNDERGQSISCYIERTLEVDANQYALLLPVDIPIEIFAFNSDDDGNELLTDLEEDTLNHVFLTARAVLAEQNLTLEKTALTWTAKGELPDATNDDIVTLDLSDEEELQEEDFQQLATFFYDDNEYAIYTPLDPLLVFVRLSPDGIPSLLEPEEFELIRPQIEDVLFDDL